MIVACERCATQFQLDDSRIPAAGVRVRCSRCKHAFQIQLPEPGGLTDSESSGPAEPANEEEESDWQFNADLPGNQSGASGGGTGQVAAPQVVDDREASPATSESSPGEMFGEPGGLESEAPEDPPPPGSLPPVGGEPPGTDPKTATPALGAPLMGPETSSGAEAPGLSDDGELSGLELDGEKDDPPDLGRRTTDGLGSPEESSEEGDEENPESWDLLGDHAEGEADEPDFAESPSSDDRTFEVGPSALIADRPRWQTWLAQAGNAFGWLMVAGLFLLGLHGGLKPVPVSELGPIAVGEGLEVVDLSGRWVDHVEAGPIYVVSGRLHNGGGQNLSAPRLAVQLLDDAGESLGPLAPMRAPRRAADLRELPLEALALGGDFGVPGMPAGEQREFEAVIGPLPNGTRQLRVVPAEAALVADGGPPTPRDSQGAPPAQSAPSSAPFPAAPEP